MRTHPHVIMPPKGTFMPKHPRDWPYDLIVVALDHGRRGCTAEEAADAMGVRPHCLRAILSRMGLLVGTFRHKRDWRA